MLVHCVTDSTSTSPGLSVFAFQLGESCIPMLHPSSCFEAYETLLQHAIGLAAHHCPFSDSDEMGVIDTGPGLLMVV